MNFEQKRPIQQETPEKTSGEGVDVENDPELSWLVPVPTFVANAPSEQPPVITGLIHPGDVMILASAPNQGKTLCIFEMARGVAHGGEAFGGRFHARQGRVVIIEQEHRAAALAERLKRAALEDKTNVRLAWRSTFALDNPREVKKLGSALQKWKPSLCVLDPLADLHEVDENNKQEMGRVLKAMWKLVAMSPQTAFVYTHHDNKGSTQSEGRPTVYSMRGSSSLGGKVDVAFSVKSKSEVDSRLSITLTQTKNRDGAILRPLTFIYDFGQLGAAAWSVNGEEAPRTNRDAGPSLRQLVFDALKERGSFRSIDEVATAIGRRKAAVNTVLQELKTEGIIVNSRSGGWKLTKALPGVDVANDNTENAAPGSSSSGSYSES
jgi:biotin operon repressor